MSNCRNTYNNYGSYLRSRGYDQQICNLSTQIENGQINLGIIDGNSNANQNTSLHHGPPPKTATMSGSVIIRNGLELGAPISSAVNHTDGAG